MIYLDTSALLKLVFAEAESDDLEAWLTSGDQHSLVSSEVTRIELCRATLRIEPAALPTARGLLASIDLLRLTGDVVEESCSIGDPLLRSLDAIHLATACSIRSDLVALVAYDRRLADAATGMGITAVRPGAG